MKLSVKYAGIKGLDASEDKRKYSTIISFLRTILLKKRYNTGRYDIRDFLSVFNEDLKNRNVNLWRKMFMSLKKPKNLLIIGAVTVALLAGTVLLANYANILPGSSDADSQVKTCQAKNSTPCSGANPVFAENANVECAQKAEAGFVAKACPVGSTKPCCAVEAVPDCCPKVCPPDCTKPCCAGEAAPSGCPMAGMSAATNSGCCPKTNTATE